MSAATEESAVLSCTRTNCRSFIAHRVGVLRMTGAELVGPWGLEPQTWPRRRPALSGLLSRNELLNLQMRFPTFDLPFAAACGE